MQLFNLYKYFLFSKDEIFSQYLRKREKNVQLLPKKKPTFLKVGFLK